MVPSISTPVTPRILPLGAAVAIQLTASNEPTAWLASLPVGLEIDSAGLISGIPTTAGITSSSITAANADGASAAVTIQFVVADNVPGLSEGNPFAQPINWELQTGELTLAGLTATDPLLSWTAGETKVVSFGISQAGILGEPGVNLLQLSLKKELDEPGIEITDDSANVTVTGSGVTARHEVAITIPATGQVATWLGDGEQSDQLNSFDGYIEALAQASTGSAGGFSANTTSNGSIASFTASQTKNNTLHIPLTLPLATAYYSLTLEFLSPSDTSLQHTFTIANATVSYANGSYSISASTPSAVTANATTVEQWDVTLSIQSLTGNASGISVAARAVSSAGPSLHGTLVAPGYSGAEDLIVNSDETITIGGSGTITVEFLAGASSLATFPLEDGDTLAELETKLATALGADAVGVKLVDGTDTIYFFVDASYAADTTIYNSSGSNSPAFGSQSFTQATYSDCSWRFSAAGIDTGETATRISRNTPVRITRHL